MSSNITTVFGSKKMIAELEAESKKLRQLGSPVEVNRAASKALNDTGRSHKTVVLRDTSKAMDLPQKLLKNKVGIKKSTARKLVARIRHYSGYVTINSLNRKAAIKMHLEARRFRQQGVRGYISEVKYKKYHWDNAFSQKYRGKNLIFRRRTSDRTPIEVPKVHFTKALFKSSIKREPEQAKLIAQRFKRDMEYRTNKIMNR